MALIFTSDVITSGIIADMGTQVHEDVFVGREATLMSTNSMSAVAGSANFQRVVVNGELNSTSDTTIRLDGDTNAVTVGTTGSVTHSDGNWAEGAIRIIGDDAILNNSGYIAGDYGVSMRGESGSVVNHGTIASVEFYDANWTVFALSIRVPFGVTSTEIGTIENHGIISSLFNAIDADENWVDGGPNNFGSSITHVNNTGSLIGNVNLGALDDRLDNSGNIYGDVDLGSDDDVYFGEYGMLGAGSNILLGAGNDVMTGGAGRELVFDGIGNDNVKTGGGDDYLRVGGGTDIYDGGSGNDYISYYDAAGGIVLDLQNSGLGGGWAGNDTISNFESASGSNTGGDFIWGTSGNNEIRTYGGSDQLSGRDGADILDGGDGNDYLWGGSGADTLLGGNGNDYLDGGAGPGIDQLYGGAASDRFHFDRGEGNDVIKDFENNIDRLEFDNFGYLTTAADALTYATTTAGGDTLFDFGADGTVLVEGWSTGYLLNDIDIV